MHRSRVSQKKSGEEKVNTKKVLIYALLSLTLAYTLALMMAG